jgi:uncharacterized Zn-binding protein involved in type VI secretion
MGQPAAKQGDQIIAIDTHIVIIGQSTSPLPHPYAGVLNGGLSGDVKIMGMPAATVGSTADNTPPHIPTPPGTAFNAPPSNKAMIQMGSTTVKINGQAAARNGDTATTCNDLTDLPIGTVIAVGTVFIG